MKIEKGLKNKLSKLLEEHKELKITKESNELLNMLQELVEMATPKTAILTHDYDGYVYECPNCHMEFRPDYIMNTVKWKGCPYCMQRLYWSEDDE